MVAASLLPVCIYNRELYFLFGKENSLEDSAKDLINYASFMVSYMRGKMPGQDTNADYKNRKNNHASDGK